MKKVLFFTDTPLLGGAELQMFLLAKFLPKERYEVSLACLSNSNLDQWCELFLQEEIKVQRLPSSYKNDPKIFYTLRGLLKKEKPDFLHIHLWNPASGRFAFLATKSLKIPFVITEHDPFRLDPFKRGLKHFLAQPKAVIAISKNNQKFLEEEYAEKTSLIQHIPNGIDIDEWKSRSQTVKETNRNSIRKEVFGLEENGFAILNVATLHERKGQETLLKAMALMLKTMPGEKSPRLKLALCGDGEHREKFVKLVRELKIENFVKFLGHRDDVPQLLFAADLFVLPSHREGFGLAILEAGMMELPVVASNVGGIPDIIEDGKDGVLVQPRNEILLAEAIMKLLMSPEKRLALGSTLREKAMKSFSAKMMAERTAEVYDKIL